MENEVEIQRITGLVAAAMQLSTDPVTAAGAVHVSSLGIVSVEQAKHLARCVAVFTTDDALADELEEIVDESPAFLARQVIALGHKLEKFTGKHADLEKRVWTLIYAGRRERSRVLKTQARRSEV